MSESKQKMCFKIAGLLFAVAGLISLISGKVPIGIMNVAIGLMFILISIRKARRIQGAEGVKSNPPADETADRT
jgi:hypothetical protein